MPAPRDPADGFRMAGALPERRVRLLDGRRLDDDVVELPVLAVEREPLVRRPRLGDDVDRFLEARLGLLHRDAEADELVVPVALADAEIQPPARQQIDRRRLFGQQHRVVPGQHDHRGAKPQRARARADPGEQVQRRRDLAEAGEVMLDDERALIAERLGLDDVLDVVLEAGGAVDVGAAALRLRRAEESELHGCSCSARVIPMRHLLKYPPQPLAGFGHRRVRLVHPAGPEEEAVVHAVPTRGDCRRSGGTQLLGVVFALVAQRVVFGGDHQRGRQAS